MRILHLVEAFTVHVDRIVSHQLAAGHDVRVVTFHDFVGRGPRVVVPRGDFVRRLPYAHHWQGIGRVLRIARSFGPDVVHGHYLSTAGLYLAACPARGRVATAMGSDVLIDPKATHARMLLRVLPRWVDVFTSVADHVTRRMVDLGISEGRISTFPWGVDSALFHPPAGPPRDGVIVSTRNFEPVYDVPTLLAAFARLAAKRSRSRVRLYGDGSLRDALLRRADRDGVAARVEFPGRVPPARLADALREAAVFVSPSLSDGTSTSLLEAMATGLLPVVTDIEANRSWVRDGENGLLFPPRDVGRLSEALDRALNDDVLRARAFDENPRIVEERASWQVSMQNLDGVYDRVLGG